MSTNVANVDICQRKLAWAIKQCLSAYITLMLEKCKDRFVEHLQIIQLCEADLNFVFHVIWVHRLTRQANKYSALNHAQYALLGQTCNNAIINKLLFLDLSGQTVTPGPITDYDAITAFNRALASLSIVTCQQMGLPHIADHFMYNLLHHTSFHLMTGVGCSTSIFHNNKDTSQIRQGVLQGSSSTAPTYIISSGISLYAYSKLSHSASFTHPFRGSTINDKMIQFVDDDTQMLNPLGADIENYDIYPTACMNSLHQHAQNNT